MNEYQAVAVTRPDGGVSIMRIITSAPMAAFNPDAAIRLGFQPSQAGTRWEGGITDEGIAAEIDRTVGLSSSMPWRRIEANEVPADRAFRGAWTDAGKSIDIDMPKARDIQRAKLRELRAPLLAELDVDYQRADETGDKAVKAAVALKKQALRDVTADPAIEAAKTPEDLAAVLPAALR